ncbi:hypothetical protein AAMO2058_000974000 [Amorphochlora amoebiformis]
MDANTNRMEAIRSMNRIRGFNVVIVCCTSASQTEYWQKRLQASRGYIAPRNARIFAVEEDWADGGAGNGLGTLYAWQKACARDKTLKSDLKAGKISVGLYHTAGKGTSVYASSRKGRLSVFWGDQVFIPSVSATYVPTHHADILARLGPMPDKKTYEEKGLFNYGLICVEKNGDAKQIEKVSYETAVSIGDFEKVGTSVGSFSVSSALLAGLMDAFSPELKAKKGKMDTDPHFWMPMTLDIKTYSDFMLSKKEFATKEEADSHYARVFTVKDRLKNTDPKGKFFGAVDVGQDAYWWDYGQVVYYMTNNLKLLKKGTEEEREEARAMRRFLNIEEKAKADGPLKAVNCSVADTTVLKDSIAKNSVLSSVTVGEIVAENSILVNVTAGSIRCKNCLLYNVADAGTFVLGEGEILVGINCEGKNVLIRSKMNVCGKKNWKKWKQTGSMTKEDLKLVTKNAHTFAEIYAKNKTADVAKTGAAVRKLHDEVRKTIMEC